ncbi:hypothetical protein HFO06_05530 [Rhizobium leguminosarum]|uniref:hypothetical protein n=1 Tax=Rhizobium leguminosarum TaxID=384 RepID=UPI001C94395F|nr:hypothetical protein [Rhizobium leguminosarum]MBY5762568.1 hypothetical protein [Rhizobium leguminosarum]
MEEYISYDSPQGGCYLLAPEARQASDQQTLFSSNNDKFTTGDAILDSHLGKALVRTSKFMSVTPAFGFYDEENAQASPHSSPSVAGTWGTVLFGRPLFRKEMEVQDKTGITVITIIAHEFAHILQYSLNLDKELLEGQTTVKRLELHADILAGFFLGARKRETPSLSMYSAGEVFNRIGDSKFTDRNHHGTPEERVSASQFGFDRGRTGGYSLDTIVKEGVNYVKDL